MNKAHFLVALIPILIIPLVSASTTVPTVRTQPSPAIKGEQLVNTTDGDYHLKGLLKNTSTTSMDFLSITASFFDLKTGDNVGERMSMVGGLFGTPHVSPGATVPFDMDIGYKANEVNQIALI